MKNADKPATPLPNGADGAPFTANEQLPLNPDQMIGLTKREHFASMAMQGLVTLKGSDCMDSDITAKQCVRYADALLKALEEAK